MEEIKVYIFDVRVYNKKDEIVKTVPHQTMKNIEKLKKTLKSGEYVRYDLVSVEKKKK